MARPKFERDPEVAARLEEAMATLNIPRRCVRNHNLSKKNLYIRPGGDRWSCRVCMDEDRQKSREKKKSEAAALKRKNKPVELRKTIPAAQAQPDPTTKTAFTPSYNVDSSRGQIIRGLMALGGEASDFTSGRAGSILYEAARAMGYEAGQASFNHLVLAMVNDGELRKEGKRTRTYCIQLVPGAENLLYADTNEETEPEVHVPDTVSSEEQETADDLLIRDPGVLHDVLTGHLEDDDDLVEDEDEGDMLALLLENIDHVAFIERIADELRRPRGVTHAEHVSQVNQVHEMYREKVAGLESELKELRLVRSDLRLLQDSFTKIQAQYNDLKTASDELMAEAATENAKLVAQIEELTKKIPGNRADPELTAKKKAAAAALAKRFQTS